MHGCVFVLIVLCVCSKFCLYLIRKWGKEKERERRREGGRDRERERERCVCVCERECGDRVESRRERFRMGKIGMNSNNIHSPHSLTTLLLHSNQLNELPYNLNLLRHLSTLVIAFNRFFELPIVVKELPSLKILIASGNYIRCIP